MSRHEVQWVTAKPLWDGAVDAPTETERLATMGRPAILRFASDDFMTDLGSVLDRDPSDLRLHRAEPRSFRIPPPGETEPRKPEVLKLYQPAHGDFHLVAASLVCRLPGLPDREVDPGAEEQVAFVLRRLADGSEWAWVSNPNAPQGKGWKRMGKRTGRLIARNEELHPLFPVRYEDGGRRRLFVGLVPTSSRESFRAAGTFSPLAEPGAGAGAPALDPRPEELQRILTRPLDALGQPPLAPPPSQAAADALEAQKQEASRFVLLDVAEFLNVNAKPAWDALSSATRPSGDVGALWTLLENALADRQTATRWRAALLKAWDERSRIAGDDPTPSTLAVNLGRSQISVSDLVDAIMAVAPSEPPLPGTGTTTASKGGADEEPRVPKLDPTGEGRYVLRCVYRRPQCGPLHPDLVSARSEEFAIASFFDVDAPARPIQIGLPIDTSIKSLRQARKNVNMLLSNELREQLTRVTDLKKAMDGNFASGESFQIGMMCSFSIPIITICALIVLMIFISLLNIVFWWMPFLRICFPILLKAK